MKKALIIAIAALAAVTLNATAQSLLTETPETPAQRTARELLLAPAQTRDALLSQIDDASQRLWSSSDPAAVIAALGTKAGPLFAINAQFGQVIAAMLQAEGDTAGLARLQGILARTKPHTINQDGTVTLLPDPTPTPEP